jgi:hypothetical protein
MTFRILGMISIYICTCAGWAILGGSVLHRTSESSRHLRGSVASIWGRPQVQTPPAASYRKPLPHSESAPSSGEKEEMGAGGQRRRMQTIPLPLQKSRLHVDIDLNHRRKGLVWHSTYGVQFAGQYQFQNTSLEEEAVILTFRLPEGQALYDGFTATVNGRELAAGVDKGALTVREIVAPGATVDLRVGYRSQGLDSWTYRFAEGATRVNDFALVMNTNFHDIDFPDSALAPVSRRKTASGWELRWEYASLLSGLNIAMAMPEKLQPGDLVSRITFFAPVSLMFFFFLLFILTLLKNIEIHPMNCFFLAAAFFAFHLLLAYTADLIDIHLAFLISSAVSIFLVVSYLRLVVGMRFALREAGLLQFLYLVGFSYTFFLEGYSALCVTIASIITLYFVMQLTGRIRWAELFQAKAKPGAFPAHPPLPAQTGPAPLP